MHTRRTFAALSAAGLASSCAATRGFGDGLMRDLGQAPRERLRLAPVHVAQDRVTRVDVGLRPYRPSGFRVAREERGSKTIVHNYGHGGGGITLSWGTSALAVDLGYDPAQRDYAVLGCGAVGLATARLLQQRGARVRIYARELSPNTTSNVAGAQWWPFSVFRQSQATPAFLDQFHAAARFAYRRFQTLLGPNYGVRWTRNYVLSNEPITDSPAAAGSPLLELAPETRDLARGEHPFHTAYVRQFDTMMIETPHYLRAMEADVRAAGAEIVVRAFASAEELNALAERTIFNCTGLGAGALFGDTEVMPARGQLAILLPQPEVDYNVLYDGLYMFPRRDGIVLGGTFERGEWSLEPDMETIATLVRRHKALFDRMAPLA